MGVLTIWALTLFLQCKALYLTDNNYKQEKPNVEWLLED